MNFRLLLLVVISLCLFRLFFSLQMIFLDFWFFGLWLATFLVFAFSLLFLSLFLIFHSLILRLRLLILFGFLIIILFIFSKTLNTFSIKLNPFKVIMEILHQKDLGLTNFRLYNFNKLFHIWCFSSFKYNLGSILITSFGLVPSLENKHNLIISQSLRLLQNLIDNFVGIDSNRFNRFIIISPDRTKHVISLDLPQPKSLSCNIL